MALLFLKGNWKVMKNILIRLEISLRFFSQTRELNQICFRGKAVRTAERRDKDSIPVAEKMQPPWDAAQPPGVDEINQALGELGVDSELLGGNGWVYIIMCQGLNSHYFHIIADGHQPTSRGLYTHYKDSVIKGGRSPIPKKTRQP